MKNTVKKMIRVSTVSKIKDKRMKSKKGLLQDERIKWKQAKKREGAENMKPILENEDKKRTKINQPDRQ